MALAVATQHLFVADTAEHSACVHSATDGNQMLNRPNMTVSAGNEMDLTMVNLDDVLPQATIMVVSVTASTTSGQPLSPETLQKVQDAAVVALKLDEDKIQILQLVQQKMHKIAPNLSTAVGTEVAARLMGVAGGLINLSKMPACNVQVSLHSCCTLLLLVCSLGTQHSGLFRTWATPWLPGMCCDPCLAAARVCVRCNQHGKPPSAA